MNDPGKTGMVPVPDPVGPLQLDAAWQQLVPPGWCGTLSGLSQDALRALWTEALAFARWEIRRFRRWRKLDEPVLGNGYDGEGVVQAAFERLIGRERVFKSVEEIRRQLRVLIKRRVGWLHARKETRLTIGEWDNSPAEGQAVSAFHNVVGGTREPKEELMRNEEAARMARFKEAFEASLGARKDLLTVFRKMVDGANRREIARATGMRVEQVKAIRAQLRRRLLGFRMESESGVKSGVIKSGVIIKSGVRRAYFKRE